MTRRLSKLFPSIKRAPRPDPSERSAAAKDSSGKGASSSSSTSTSTRGRGCGGGGAAAERASGRRQRGGGGGASSRWSVYLIVSSQLARTYVGVTTNFPRRLKQHNGELKGGAKASHAGRPWICACIVRGFKDKNEAFRLEAKWKSVSRKLPRKNKDDNISDKLILHRKAALSRVMDSLDCCHLNVDWMAGSS